MFDKINGWNGKMKAITFSYDDAVTQDVRLIEIFNKYGLKCTFNINSELLGKPGELVVDGVKVPHNKVNREDVRKIYEGHEVAVHTLTHPRLPDIADDAEVIRQVEQDRLNLSELVGYEVIGMAYPCGGVNSDERTAKLIAENTGVKYARSLGVTHSFEPYEDLYQYKGTFYSRRDWKILFEQAKAFLEMETDTPKVMYIWGHAYEFDVDPEFWDVWDEFCKLISGRDDIFYGTNKEVLL